MPNKYTFTSKNRLTGKVENVGYAQLTDSDEKAKLYFYGDIVSATWQSMWYEEDKCPQDIADFINQIEDTKEIEIYFNSGGGDVFAGIAIYNLLKRHSGKVTGYVDGLAASIASVILCACDEVIREAGSQIMVHKPWSWDMGNANDFRKLADDLDKCEECMIDIYMTKAKDGVTKEDIAALLEAETWLTDDVFDYFNFKSGTSKSSAQACSSMYFDKYSNVPKALIKKDEDETQVVNTDEIAQAVLNKIEEKEDRKRRTKALKMKLNLIQWRKENE